MTHQTCNSPSVSFISFNSIFRRSPCTRFRFFKILPTRISCIVSYFVLYCVFLCRSNLFLSFASVSAFAKIPVKYSFFGGGNVARTSDSCHHATIIHHDSSLTTQSKLQLIIIISPRFNSSPHSQDSTHHHAPRLQLIIIPGFNSSSFRHQHSVNISVPTTKTVPSSASVVPDEFNVRNSSFKHLYFPSKSVQFSGRIP